MRGRDNGLFISRRHVGTFVLCLAEDQEGKVDSTLVDAMVASDRLRVVYGFTRRRIEAVEESIGDTEDRAFLSVILSGGTDEFLAYFPLLADAQPRGCASIYEHGRVSAHVSGSAS